MEKTRNKPKELLPYGMILTRLFKHVVSIFPELEIDHYISYDRVMHPLAPHYERKTRSDHGKKRPRDSNASSSSTTLNHPSSSHLLDDIIDVNDEESNDSSLRSNDPYDDRGNCTVSGNKTAPDNSTNSPRVNTVVEAAKDQTNLHTDNLDNPGLSGSTSSRKDTKDIRYATETGVLEGIPGTILSNDAYEFKGENIEYFGQLFESPEPGVGQNNDNGVMLILLVYVDDIIVTGNNVDEIYKFKQFLGSKFLINDLDRLKYFLGIEVLDVDNEIYLTQRKYCTKLLTEFGMLACNPCSNPIEVNPDNKKIVMHNPMQSHLRLSFRVLRYLKREHGLCITFKESENTDIKVFVDSDWEKCKVTRRSIIGYIVFLGNSLVSWDKESVDRFAG
ncbi:ribonuclease H-like domain-containing protein [Tanacetum coccineum]